MFPSLFPPSVPQISNDRRATIFIDCDKAKFTEAICADVCIIGSGPAALALARSLSDANKTVVMIERGGSIARPPKRNVLFKSRPYGGIHNGIAFGYGGTATLWGGQLLPMLGTELAALGDPWNTATFADELQVHYQTIESWVGVSSTPYGDSLLKLIDHSALGLNWCSITPLFSKWIPFRRRNLGSAWKRVMRRSGKVRVFLHLHPIDWEFMGGGENKTIRSVTCCSQNGQSVSFKAKYFVIAAGALESPLIIEKMLGDDVSIKLGVGHTLHDHLSLRVAEVTDYRPDEYEKLFAPFFTGNTMRSMRLCLAEEKNLNHATLGWAYCHFVIETPPDSGFALARDLLRSLQAKDYSGAAKAMLNLPSALGDIAKMAWMRYVNRRLSLSRGSRVFINVDFVQLPSADNKINMSSSQNADVIEVDWNISEDIGGQVNRALRILNTFWKANNLQQIGKIQPIIYGDNNAGYLSNLYDIYHPAGTCAIGRVVDSDLKIYGVSNGYVVGSAVFPMLGRSNPTFTIMALSLRLGALIVSLFEKGN
jgi:hypothetical protein